MSTTVTMNSVVYTVPTADEVDWAQQELTWKQGVASVANANISSIAANTSAIGTNTSAISSVVNEVNVIQALGPNPAIMAFAANALPTANGTYYLRPFAYDGTADGNEVQIAVPVSGVVAKLYVHSFLVVSGTQYVFTVRKEGTDTALTCALSDGIQSDYDTVNSFTVDAGDLLSVSVLAQGISTGTGTVYATFIIKAV